MGTATHFWWLNSLGRIMLLLPNRGGEWSMSKDEWLSFRWTFFSPMFYANFAGDSLGASYFCEILTLVPAISTRWSSLIGVDLDVRCRFWNQTMSIHLRIWISTFVGKNERFGKHSRVCTTHCILISFRCSFLWALPSFWWACSSVQDMYRYRTQRDGADSTPSMAFCARGVALGARPIYPEFQTQGGGPLYCRNHPICWPAIAMILATLQPNKANKIH